MNLESRVLEVDGERLFCEISPRKDNVVILHGAGEANRKRYYALAEAILRRGVGVILFDFSGHGESTGELKSLSLSRRKTQAQSVIKTFAPKEGYLYLVGFSMSGQTVCDLLSLYKERIPAILLGCPGVYSKSVYGMLFGGGEFTTKIRAIDSWKDSTAFDELSNFEGKTVIAIGGEDQVIPKEVITQLKESSKHFNYIEYPGVEHQLAMWLATHKKQQEELLDLLLE